MLKSAKSVIPVNLTGTVTAEPFLTIALPTTTFTPSTGAAVVASVVSLVVASVSFVVVSLVVASVVVSVVVVTVVSPPSTA